MLKFLAEVRKCALAASATMLAGCSIHPIPDDVSRYATEDIVRHVRCEAKDAVRDEIRKALIEHNLGDTGIEADKVLAPGNFELIRRRDPKLAAKFLGYGASTITYDFEFTITETNNKSGTLAFAVPFVNSAGFTLGLDGGLDKTRNAIRKFRTMETFKELDELPCEEAANRRRPSARQHADVRLPDPNPVYPLTGSIGVRRIMRTFIKVSELGGGEGDFTDTITFTTVLHGNVNPKLVLAPVTDRFRMVSAEGHFDNSRTDMHKVIITMAFPKIPAVVAGQLRAGPSILPAVSADTEIRARISRCIASAEARENEFGTLRMIPPQEYCQRNVLNAVERRAAPQDDR